jgi:hypothetical protein
MVTVVDSSIFLDAYTSRAKVKDRPELGLAEEEALDESAMATAQREVADLLVEQVTEPFDNLLHGFRILYAAHEWWLIIIEAGRRRLMSRPWPPHSAKSPTSSSSRSVAFTMNIVCRTK